MFMKEFLAMLLAIMMMLSLVACGGGDDEIPSGSEDAPSDPVIADGWDLPEYPYGKLVYTEYDDDGAVVALYFNNTTIEECREYCLSLANAGYQVSPSGDIRDDSDGSGKWIWCIVQHFPIRYSNGKLLTNPYEIFYKYDKMEHTVDTPDGEVVYQLVINLLYAVICATHG